MVATARHTRLINKNNCSGEECKIMEEEAKEQRL
jgi:hypothetical protein